MLQVDLGALNEGPIEVVAEVAGNSELFNGLDFRIEGDVGVSGRLFSSGDTEFYWRGDVAATVVAECRRCLEPVELRTASHFEALFTPDADNEDPAVYVIARNRGEIDLSDAVREELILSVPALVLCRTDCRGICAGCGANLNSDTCRCAPAVDTRWAELDKLKGSVREGERK